MSEVIDAASIFNARKRYNLLLAKREEAMSKPGSWDYKRELGLQQIKRSVQNELNFIKKESYYGK